jgi:2-polyprenyl-3-methyl-5-hydroxy-6-metoxy-1,4-benzoquinol methylase
MDISEYSRLHITSNYSRHPWEIARSRVLLSLLDKYVPLPQPRLVDIGSGDAYVINRVFQAGVAKSYYAIDINYTPAIVSQLKQNNPGAPIDYLSDIREMKPAGVNPEATLYLCMDVLEHLENEREVLDLIANPPVPKGSAFYFFSVPAFQSVFSNHDVLLGHYRRYTVAQLRELCVARGLEVIDSGYFFFTLLLARWVEKKLIKKKDYSIDNWEGGPLKTKILTAVLGLDFGISRLLRGIGFRLPGLSSYCICRV